MIKKKKHYNVCAQLLRSLITQFIPYICDENLTLSYDTTDIAFLTEMHF